MNGVSKPHEKICLLASMIAINVSVEICQFANFLNLEKGQMEYNFLINYKGGRESVYNWQLVIIRQTRWPPHGAANFVSHRAPLGQISGSAIVRPT